MIAGILDHDAGECRVFDRDLQAFSGAARTRFRGNHVGFVFQAFNLIPTLSAAENVAVPLLINGRQRKEALERVKMIPAATGAPGTRVSFGKWNRRAWMGAGYLVARRLDPDGARTHRVARFGED